VREEFEDEAREVSSSVLLRAFARASMRDCSTWVHGKHCAGLCATYRYTSSIFGKEVEPKFSVCRAETASLRMTQLLVVVPSNREVIGDGTEMSG